MRTAISKILFPVSFSASCTAMAPYVQRAAALLRAQVTLIHVVDPQAFDMMERYELYLRPQAEIAEDHRLVHAGRFEQFLKAEFGPASARVLLTGDPAAEISRYAEGGGFDLIILPTHAGRFRQRLLGSTTARVINDAACPVLTSSHAEAISPRPLAHRQWICAVGSSDEAEDVLGVGAAYARRAGAALSLLHVVPTDHARGGVSLDGPSLANAVAVAEQRLARWAERHSVTGPVQVFAGPLKSTLLTTIAGMDADTLIVGRSAVGEGSGRMADLTYAFVRESPFPVLSV